MNKEAKQRQLDRLGIGYVDAVLALNGFEPAYM
jgi:hypothetical protein